MLCDGRNGAACNQRLSCLYWLCYRHNNSISVVVEPGASLIHAKMRAALTNLVARFNHFERN